WEDQMCARFAVVRTRIVIHIARPPTTHAPNRSNQRLTTRMGPPIARAVHTTATIPSHAWYGNAGAIRWATRLMAQNSNPVHPTSWATLRTDGRYDPRSPR